MSRQLLACFFVLLSAYSTLADPVVELPDGQVKGKGVLSPNNVEFTAFLGIPYAKPPVGELRFQAPEPPEQWDDILDATEEPKACISIHFNENTTGESEDCLYINVFTPNISSSEKLPVMFWIYGGAFMEGSSKIDYYGPDFFVEQDVIVVSFNYRLGPFGFLSTGDDVVPGNAGLKDQNLALKWTHDNIELFGGDPDKITVFGQSAGGTSVCLHVISNLSAGLFRAAICQSGSALVPWATTIEPKPIACRLLQVITDSEDVDCSSENILNTLRDLPVEDIIPASILVTASRGNELAFVPTLEPPSEGAFLTQDNYNYDILEQGRMNNVSLMIGVTSQEFLTLISDVPTFISTTTVNTDENPTVLIPSNLHISSNETAEEVAQEIKDIYLDEGTTFSEFPGALVKYWSDDLFTRGVRKHAELQSNHVDVYYYQFSYVGDMKHTNNTVEGAEGVGHGSEILFMFKQNRTLDNSDLTKYTERDLRTHNRLLKMWTDFAKTMNPTPEASSILQNVTWPVLEPCKFQYLDIGDDLEIKTELGEEVYEAWTDIYEKWLEPPRVTY